MFINQYYNTYYNIYIECILLLNYYRITIIFFPHERRGLFYPILVIINLILSSSYIDKCENITNI